MICSYDKTLVCTSAALFGELFKFISQIYYSDRDNGSIYLHLAEDERINEYLGVFGTHRKVIFYINGYGEDMNADNDGE